MFPGLFYVKVVFSMDDATVFMLKKGQTSISNLLLENYTDLGLNDGEFLLLLMLMKFDQQKEDGCRNRDAAQQFDRQKGR